MRQKGGSMMNSNTVFIVVVLIAVFNVIAYMHVQDWNSLAVFVLTGVIAFTVTMDRTLGVVAAVVASSLFRASNNLMREGLESQIKTDTTNVLPNEDSKQALSASSEIPANIADNPKITSKNTSKKAESSGAKKIDPFTSFMSEGMSGQLDQLQNNQQVLSQGIKALQPLMQQASSMLKGLPSGFLDEAIKNFSKNRK